MPWRLPRPERVLREAVARVIEENRKLGLPVAVMKNGKAVLIPAEKVMAAVRETRAKHSTRKK